MENYMCPECLGYPPETYYQTEQETDSQILTAERNLKKLRGGATRYKMELQNEASFDSDGDESDE